MTKQKRKKKTDEAFDSRGRYLGFFATEEQRQQAEVTGRIGVLPPSICELSAWELWNDHVQHNPDGVNRTMQDEDGRQIVVINDDQSMFLRVSKDKSGWRCEWLNQEEFEREYWDEESSTMRLVFADEVFILE